MFVKAMIQKHTQYMASFNDAPYFTEKDYYTTVEVDEQDANNDSWIRSLARKNLTKRIAMVEFVDIRYWVNIWLDVADIKVIR